MFVAYLVDEDTAAYGIGDFGVGQTREEAIASLRDKTDPEIWAEVRDGEEMRGWSGLRMFVGELPTK
jgi:hypothetical protein